MLNYEPGITKKAQSPALQPKLKIGRSGDKYERKADAIADKVMSTSHADSMQMQPLEEEEELLQPMIQMQPLEEEEEMLQPKIQMQEEEEEEMVQPKLRMQPVEEEEEMIQPKANDSMQSKTTSIANSLSGSKGSGRPLPDSTNRFMSGAFGADFSKVRVHTGSNAIQMSRELKARAFTYGSDIYFNKQQFSPDSVGGKKLLAHELTHTIQQGKSALLKKESGSEALQMRNSLQMFSMQTPMIQMSPVNTAYGTFIDNNYKTIPDGVSIKLEFDPGTNVDAEKIALMQSLKPYTGGNASPVSPTQAARTVSSGPGQDYYHDRTASRNNPIYGGRSLSATETLKDTPLTNATKTYSGSYQLGFHYTDAAGAHDQNAWLSDSPSRPGSGNNSGQIFETTALAIEGAQNGTYYGSVQWGWTRSTSGTFTRLPLSVVSQGAPSQNFMAAAEEWNRASARGTYKASASPTQIYDASYAADFTVTKGTTMTLAGGVYTHNNTPYNQATITSGSESGNSGRVKVADVQDQGDGAATADIPIIDVHKVDNPAGVNLGPGPVYIPLPYGTRVRVVRMVSMTEVEIEVVDGPHTGSTGTVNFGDLVDENP